MAMHQAKTSFTPFMSIDRGPPTMQLTATSDRSQSMLRTLDKVLFGIVCFCVPGRPGVGSAHGQTHPYLRAFLTKLAALRPKVCSLSRPTEVKMPLTNRLASRRKQSSTRDSPDWPRERTRAE